MLFIYYDHSAFQELVLEVQQAFQNLDIKVMITNEIKPQNVLDLYLIFGMNNFTSPIVPRNYIVYQLEQTTGNDQSHWFSPIYMGYLSKALAVWDYSLVNYQNLKTLGLKNLEYVPITYLQGSHHPLLPLDKDIDVLFLGSMNPRRQKILDTLRQTGINVVVETNVWGDQRHQLLSRSQVVLNIHYYEHAILETTRLSYLLTQGCHVISENSRDPLLDKAHQDLVLMTDYDHLVSTCVDYLRSQGQAQSDSQWEINLRKYQSKPMSSQIPAKKIVDTYNHLLSRGNDPKSVTSSLNLPRPIVDSSDLAEVKTEVTSRGEVKLKLPRVIPDEELPCVSLVTLTYNRKHVFPMAIRNWRFYQYPRDKIEWIIVDDSDDGSSLSDLLPKSPQIKYYKLQTTGRLSIGQKRNFGVKNASHELVVFMDDDDYYYPISLYARVALLLEYPQSDLVGVTYLDMYDVVNDFSAKINSPYLSEASMAFRKSFWRERSFPDQFSSLGEGVPWTTGRRDRCLKMPSCFNLIAMTHWDNYTGEGRSYNQFPNVDRKSNLLSILDLETRLFIVDLFDKIRQKQIAKS